jgi:Cbb3-type cytochrome oxidase, subunit 1
MIARTASSIPTRTVGSLFLRTAVIAALAGLGLGIFMGASHDHTFRTVHAHINLVGWVSLFLFGLFYSLMGTASVRLAKIHYGLATIGLVLFAIGLPGIVLGHPWGEPVTIVASLATVLSMALFTYVVFTADKAAPPTAG